MDWKCHTLKVAKNHKLRVDLHFLAFAASSQHVWIFDRFYSPIWRNCKHKYRFVLANPGDGLTPREMELVTGFFGRGLEECLGIRRIWNCLHDAGGVVGSIRPIRDFRPMKTLDGRRPTNAATFFGSYFKATE